MKRWLVLVCIPLLVLTGCEEPVVEPDLSAYTAGKAEIPLEIWGELEEETRQALTGEPKYVALTFDDGPRADTTSLLLNGLLERGVSATFFVVGQQIQGNEALLRRMVAEGHQVGNHTYSHVRLSSVEEDAAIQEVQKTDVLLREVLGEDCYWLRPPYGLIDAERAELLKAPMVNWSLDPEDWKTLDAKAVTDYVLCRVQPGDIILLHDFYHSSVDAALEIVDTLQGQGYTFVTVEELFRIQGVTPQAGTLYVSPSRPRALS